MSATPVHFLGHHWRSRRLIIALVAALTLLMLSTAVALADTAPTAESPVLEQQDPIPLDPLCVSGQVIDHAEQPLGGWTITATYEGVNGEYPVLTAVSDKDGKFEFQLPGPGRWALEIEARERWEGVTTTRLAVHVGFGKCACVHVRFKMREIIQVKAIKIDEKHTPQPGWKITATPGAGNTFGAPQTKVTDDNGEVVFDLTPGSWVFTEAPPKDALWWLPISPPDGIHRLLVVGPGPHTIRFKNMTEMKPKGCINVFKYDVPPDPAQPSFGLAGWVIEVRRANGSIADAGMTDSFGQITFVDLPYGPYTVKEIMQPGWEADSPTSYAVVLTSQDEGCTDIIFYNKQMPLGYCFEGRKVDVTGGFGIPDWEITATPVEPGGFTPEPVLTDGEGRYRIRLPIGDYRIPGAVYEISEVIPDGWTAVSPASYLIILPEHPDICVPVPDFVNQQKKYADAGASVVDVAGPSHAGCRAIHTVKPGDSAYKIAAHYGVPGQSILRANPWIAKQRHNWLYVGQKVCVP